MTTNTLLERCTTIKASTALRSRTAAPVIERVPAPRLLPATITIGARISLFVGAVAAIAVGAAAMINAGVGAGPGDVFLSAVARQAGVAHGTAGMALAAMMAAAATLLGHRPRAGTVAAAVSIGPLLNVMLTVIPMPGPVEIRYALASVGLVLIAVGVAAAAVARVGRAVTEHLIAACAERTSISETRLRLALESGYLLAGFALGGIVGPFTVVVALTIGPLVAVATRAIDATWGAGTRSVSQLYTARLSRL